MPLFKSNKISINNESVSEQLYNARKEKKIKLKDAAKKLNINHKYLKALEKGEYDKLPEGIYGKNFLREYAFFLGLNSEESIKLFEQENKIQQSRARQELFSKQKVKKRAFLIMPKIIKNIIIIAITSIFFIYLGLSLKKIISPPNLRIYYPTEKITIKKNTISIIGQTDCEARVIINNEQILTNINGEFSKAINLKNGINLITITASKKYGRDKTVVRQVLVNR